MQKAIDPPPLAEEIRGTSQNINQRFSPITLGIIFGLIAAVGYTLANIALRKLSGTEKTLEWQVWVTFMKAVPAAVVAWGLITYRASKGLIAFPPLRMVIPLIAIGLVMQLGGNLCFQWALSHIELAMTVPLCFSTLICTGAGLGRVWLGEPILKKTVIAMLSLIVSISLIGAGMAFHDDKPSSKDSTTINATELETTKTSPELTVLAMLAACVSGVSYGACGVVIRKLVKELPISAALVTFSSTGVIVLGAVSLSSFGIGYEAISNVSGWNWVFLWSAGCANAMAFFAVGGAMQRLEVVRVNLLNAAQVAMCAIAGVLIFGEELTVWLMSGIVLTIAGLVLMGMKRRKQV